MGEPGTLLRTPSGLRSHLNDDCVLETYNQWRGGPGQQFSTALGADAHFDKQRSAFETRKPHHDLKDALLEYQKAGLVVGFEIETCSWTDVTQQLEKAQETYKIKGDKNPFRAGMRHGTTISTTLTPLLALIPDQWGLNILHAGLAMIFQAVQQRATNRDKIFQAFELIPEILEKAKTTRQIHPREESLRENVVALYKVLFEEIPILIETLLREQHVNFFKRMAKQIPAWEQTVIDASIVRVNKAYTSLKNCLDNISHEKIAKIDQDVTRVKQNVESIRKTATSTHVEVGYVAKDLKVVDQKVQAVQDDSTRILDEAKAIRKESKEGIEELKREFAASRQAALEAARFDLTIINGMFYVWAERAFYQGYQYAQQAQHPQELIQQDFKISISQLLSILNVPSDAANKDLGYILRQSNSFDQAALGHVFWLMSTPGFKDWMLSGDVLLVDGHCDPSRMGKTSPMSVFCANFIANIAKFPSTIVLHFFCGQHMAFNGSRAGGMLRTLICQLLLYPTASGPNFEIFGQDELLNALRAHNIDAMGYVLRQLVKQIPTDAPVFCIIDGISEYETQIDNSTKDLKIVIDVLQSLAMEQAGTNFKVLMTSANKSNEIVHQIPSYQRISLRAGNTHSSAVSARAFMTEIMHAGRFLEQPPPREQVLPWNQSPHQLEGAPPAPELLPWMAPQWGQTLVESNTFPPPAAEPWKAMHPPAPNYPY